MIYTYRIEDLMLKTGDVICTRNGKPDILPGEFWLLVGRLVPGDVDHVAIYLGPDGHCIEAGSRGVNPFHAHNGVWDAEFMTNERGLLLDSFYGVAYPLAGLDISDEEENQMRAKVAEYVLSQVGKTYNLNFLNTNTENSFYCSQLVYKAYQKVGINLNTGLAMEELPGTNKIIYPQEIWDGCVNKRSKSSAVKAEDWTISLF